MDNKVAENLGFIVINENYITQNGGNAANVIQNTIDNNPNRTIFFADGLYVLDKPVCTPADPEKSVDLQLSRYTVIKACDGWKHTEALIRLGGKDPCNCIATNGSYYTLQGGIIDGNGVANGISIDSGRETAVRDVSIKGTKVGLHIKYGANYGSSDCDISNINIVGNKARDSVGVLVEGLDNRLTNMRIASVFIGVHLKIGGNFLSDIHPLFTVDYDDYSESCAFKDESGSNNWYMNCYNDQFGNGFYFTNGGTHILNNCYNYWYASKGQKHIGIRNDGPFNTVAVDFKFDTREDCENTILQHNGEGGTGVFERLSVFQAFRLVGDDHIKFIKDKMIER